MAAREVTVYVAQPKEIVRPGAVFTGCPHCGWGGSEHTLGAGEQLLCTACGWCCEGARFAMPLVEEGAPWC